MPPIQRITPCLWFDHQAEAAVEHYCAIFSHSRVLSVSRYGEAGREFHGKPPGSVMALAFELAGQEFTALNGGPEFRFTEAISLQVGCETQAEIDYYWEKLSADGDPRAQQCGWLKDKFGVSWQVLPRQLSDMLNDPDVGRSQRVMLALLRMKKLELGVLQRAYAA
jgi:predicted 3-demethylubiquinone-9 3-methyltransferase (glyoxalase superfamily)